MSEFHEAIASIAYQPHGNQASGIVAPLMRASGHILYLVGALAEPGYTLTDEEAARELDDAKGHLADTIAAVTSTPSSTNIKTRVINFVQAVHLASASYADWTPDERGPNLRALADAATTLGALLDRELFGYGASDPGRSL